MIKETKISLVIPVYNEAENIPLILEEITQVLSNINFLKDYEIIFIDDCSTDNSKKIIENITSLKVKKIFNKINQGQSYSLYTGISSAQNDIIVTMDGDLQNNPNDIPNMLSMYLSNPSVKLLGGIRAKRKDNFIKILSSKIANNIRSFLLNDNCLDTGCALKIFDKHIFLEFPYFNGLHRFLPALFKGFGYKTVFFTVDHRLRKHGKSNYGTFKRLLAGIRDIIKVALIIKKHKRS